MIRLWYGIGYVLWILVEIVKGSVGVAKSVYSPSTRSSPALIEFPLRCTTDAEIIAMASSITITPGTLVVGTAHGTAEEHPSLFVHVLFAESREQVLADLIDMEDRLLRVTRGRGGAQADPPRKRGGFEDPRYADGRATLRVDQEADREVAPSEPIVPRTAQTERPAPEEER